MPPQSAALPREQHGPGISAGQCWLAATSAPLPQLGRLTDTSRSLLERAAQIVAPRSPAQPLKATLEEIESLEASAIEVATRLTAAPAPSEQAEHFDRRFGLRRSHDDNVIAPALARATAIAARLSFEAGTDSGDIEAIAEGLALCLGEYTDGALRRTELLPGRSEGIAIAMSARGRWDRGHQLFSAFGQETIFVLLRLEAALHKQDWADARDRYLDAITLFRAIASTMRRAGAMTPDEYAIVRQSMEPPNVPQGFSGLWDSGHRRILGLTRAIARLPGHPKVRVAKDRYHLAISLLFHAHSSVCEQVAGEKASLAAQANQTAPPGHISLRSFASRALMGAGYHMETSPMTAFTPLPTPSPSIVTIIERIPLKSAYWSSEGAFNAGQAYDLAAAGNAHLAEGHIGHAAFFWEQEPEGCSLILLYPWLDRQSAVRLLESEEQVLGAWFEIFAAGPRQVSLLDELPVDVEDAP